jgi:hypothetical protein
MKKRLLLGVIFSLVLVHATGIGTTNAWWSVPYYDRPESTHFMLGQASIGLVTPDASRGNDRFHENDTDNLSG